MSAVLWEPRFEVYRTSLEEARVAIALDMNAAAHAPVASHPYLLCLRIAMHAPDEEGLCSPDEFDALNALETALLENVVPLVDGLHIGHMIWRGSIDLVMYCPPAAVGQLPAIDLCLEEVRGAYEVVPILQEDDGWDFYNQIMFPDPYNLQFILNRRLLKVIVRQGDDLAAVRQVDHIVFFPEEEPAQAASVELAATGFTVEPPVPMGDDVEDDDIPPIWCLSFYRDEALADQAIDRAVVQVLDVILPLGGDYDGWECSIVPKKSS